MLFFKKIYKVGSTVVSESGYSLYNSDNPIITTFEFLTNLLQLYIIVVAFFRSQKSPTYVSLELLICSKGQGHLIKNVKEWVWLQVNIDIIKTITCYCYNWNSTITIYSFVLLKGVSILQNLTQVTVLAYWVWNAFLPVCLLCVPILPLENLLQGPASYTYVHRK